MSTEFIALLANLALTLSVIVAVIFGIVQVKSGNRDRHERLTLETLRNFQTREFAELINYTTITKFPNTYEEWRSFPNEDQIKFIQLAQQMEALGILLADKLIDIDLVDKTLGSFVTTCWLKYKPIFFILREKNSDPFLAEYFQWIAELIDKRMKENPRAPFYVRT
jgi:hypothetical protein